jgi:hypothetical protein
MKKYRPLLLIRRARTECVAARWESSSRRKENRTPETGRHEANKLGKKPILRFFRNSKKPYPPGTYKTVRWQTLALFCFAEEINESRNLDSYKG